MMEDREGRGMVSRVAWLFGVLVLMCGANAEAYEGVIVTYGYFDPVNSAVRFMELVFDSDDYMRLFSITAGVGMFLAVLASVYNSLFAKNGNALHAIWGGLFGMALFSGLVLPKGELTVTDASSIEVGGPYQVPDVIVVIADALSRFEYQAVLLTEDVAVGDPSVVSYTSNNGGTAYEILMRSVPLTGQRTDRYLQLTIEDYVENCVLPAATDPLKDVSINELRASVAEDLVTQFEKADYVTRFASIYDAANKSGAASTCQNTWNNISGRLTAASYERYMHQVCDRANVIGASEANAEAHCEAMFDMAIEPLGFSDRDQYWHNGLLAHSLLNVVEEMDPEMAMQVIANAEIMKKGLSVGAILNEWIPILRGIMLSIVIGIIPFAITLVVTPLFGRVLLYIGGSFIWFAAWGIIDAVIFEFMNEAALRYLEQSTSNGFGLLGMLYLPDASEQALALFGRARSLALVLATSFVFIVFRFGGNALSSLATGTVNDTSAAATTAANGSMDAVGRTRLLESLARAVGVNAAVSNSGDGFSGLSASTAVATSSNMASASTMSSVLGSSAAGAGNRAGAVDGGGQAGRVQAFENLSGGGDSAASVAALTSRVEADRRVGAAEGTLSQAGGSDGQVSNIAFGDAVRSTATMDGNARAFSAAARAWDAEQHGGQHQSNPQMMALQYANDMAAIQNGKQSGEAAAAESQASFLGGQDVFTSQGALQHFTNKYGGSGSFAVSGEQLQQLEARGAIELHPETRGEFIERGGVVSPVVGGEGNLVAYSIRLNESQSVDSSVSDSSRVSVDSSTNEVSGTKVDSSDSVKRQASGDSIGAAELVSDGTARFGEFREQVQAANDSGAEFGSPEMQEAIARNLRVQAGLAEQASGVNVDGSVTTVGVTTVQGGAQFSVGTGGGGSDRLGANANVGTSAQSVDREQASIGIAGQEHAVQNYSGRINEALGKGDWAEAERLYSDGVDQFEKNSSHMRSEATGELDPGKLRYPDDGVRGYKQSNGARRKSSRDGGDS